eukprot:3999802-Pyramimonas_sp.AAC.1
MRQHLGKVGLQDDENRRRAPLLEGTLHSKTPSSLRKTGEHFQLRRHEGDEALTPGFRNGSKTRNISSKCPAIALTVLYGNSLSTSAEIPSGPGAFAA